MDNMMKFSKKIAVVFMNSRHSLSAAVVFEHTLDDKCVASTRNANT